MANLKVAKLQDIAPDKITEVAWGGQTIVLLQHQGEIRAFQGLCPHKGTPLSLGHIEDGQVVCPAHKWKFSCLTGKAEAQKACLKSFPVFVEGDDILLAEEAIRQEAPDAGKATARAMDTLPSPKGDFVVGHLAKFSKPNKHRIMADWAKECGPVFVVHLIGKKILMVMDPDMNKEILKKRPDKFRRLSKVDQIMREMGIVGVSNVEGETWQRHRKVTAEALNVKNVNGYFPIIARVAGRLYGRLQGQAKAGGAIEIVKDMMRFTVDNVSAIAFGYDMNTVELGEDAIQHHLALVFPMIEKRVAAPFPL